MAVYYIAREPFTFDANGETYQRGDVIVGEVAAAIGRDPFALSHVNRHESPDPAPEE